MRSSALLAVAALLSATPAPAEPGKSAQPAKPAHPAAQPAQPAKPAQPARERGAEGRGKSDEAPAAHGKSAAAHENAPGQADKPRGERDETKTAGASNEDETKQRELGQTRDKRRKEHRDQLQGRYGSDLLQRPAILAELKTHAWRMARLERMRTLAEALADAGKRKKTTDRLDKLIAKEKARHDRQMDHLKGQGEMVAAGVPAEGAGKPEPSPKPEGAGKPEHAGRAPGPGQGPEKRAEKAGGGQ